MTIVASHRQQVIEVFDVQPSLDDRLIQIPDAIQSIHNILADHTEGEILGDLKRRLALERLFQIVSDTSGLMPPEIKANAPQISWRKISNLGNTLRHKYYRVDVPALISMAETDLPRLQAFVERVLADEKASGKQ